MSLDIKKVGVFSRRIFIVGILKIVAFVIIFGRLLHLQVFTHRKYLDKSTSNYSKSFIIPPKRGHILDNNGVDLAYSAKYWRVLIKGRKKDSKTLIKVLDFLKISENVREYIINKYHKNPFEDFIIYEFLSQDQLVNMEINLPYLQNVYVVEGVARSYKDNFAYSNLLGYIRTPTVDDIKSGRSKHPDIKIGATGLERVFNKTLTGIHGHKIIEVDALGHKIKDLAIKKPVAGESMHLTLDNRIQVFMHKLAQNSVMSSVVMEVDTGNILGIVSSPTFNSTQLSQKISQKEWHDIIDNPSNPMLNRAYQSTYAPGSIFKVIVALAALRSGVNPNKKFYCNGRHKVGSRVFRCWKSQGHGMVDLHHGIKYSCNVYFYHLANYITADNIKSIALELGLEQSFNNLPFYGQKKGIIPNDAWARSIGKIWHQGDLINTIIGQGYTSCTTMQLATAMSRICTGKKIIPKVQTSTTAFKDLDITAEHLYILQKALYSSANELGGTSFSRRIKEGGYEFAGKTGTAQVVSKFVDIHEKYKNIEEKPNGLFAGFAPFHRPKFAIAAIYENGGYGASSALPFSSKVLLYTQKLYTGKAVEAEKFKEDIFNKL